MTRLLVTAFLLIGIAARAWACGNPMIYAMLFAKYPDAKIAYDAELDGRASGLLSDRIFPGTPGLSYHKWSLGEATDIVTAMNSAIASRLPDGESLTILLADEVYAVRFSAGQQTPEMVSLQVLVKEPHFDAYSTTNALRAIQQERVDWQEAMRLNLVVTNSSHFPL